MASGAASGVIYLVDAHSLIFQVFHAIPAMTSPSGLPTNAVFGFVRDLLYLRRRKPDYLVCAFDRPEPTFRAELLPRLQGPPGTAARRSVAADPADPSSCRGAGHSGRQPPALRGRRRAGHAGPRGGQARPGRLHLHQRQGLPAADRRPRSTVQPPQAPGIRPGGTARRLGHDARTGGGLADPGRRRGGQRARRARHRRQDGGQAAAGVRHPRQPVWPTSTRFRGQAAGEPAGRQADRRHEPATGAHWPTTCRSTLDWDAWRLRDIDAPRRWTCAASWVCGPWPAKSAT